MSRPTVHPFILEALRGADAESLLAQVPDAGAWQAVDADAVRQGLAPFFHRRLKRPELAGRMPASARARLERAAADVAARNMLLAAELEAILSAAETQGLRVAPLRGLVLAERLHGDIAARPMGDLDLLVPRDDLPAIARLLEGLGFREMDRRPGFSRRYSYTLKFVKDHHGWVIVEPHWTLAYPPFVQRFAMQGVWARCVRGEVVGRPTWLLSPDDLLLHLLLHVAHREDDVPLLWLWELDRLVRDGGGVDWSRLLTTAEAGGVAGLLARPLAGLRALFRTPVPDDVLDRIARPPAPSFEARLVRLLADRVGVDGKESLAVFLTLRGVGERLRYLVALLFPSPEFMRLQYAVSGPAAIGLAYLRRLGYFSWEGLRGVARLLV